MTATLAGRLEIPVTGLAADLRDRLRRTAAFANPVFFERERARLSTHNTPRVIACHEQAAECLLLPRGCLDAVRAELERAGIELLVHDHRHTGAPIDVAFSGALSAQQDAAVAAARHRRARRTARLREDRDGDRPDRAARTLDARARAPPATA